MTHHWAFEKRTTMSVLLILGLCLCVVLGLHWITEQGRSTIWYITGQVISVDEDGFCMTVLPEASKVDTELSAGPCCFEMKDFHSPVSLPEIGETIRITCSHDMSVLIGIYDNPAEFSD